MFSGLRSRWTTPSAWAYASADATSRPSCTAAATLKGPCRIRRSRSVPVSTYGMT